MVGLYCPPYMKDLNATGWHLHFISEDREKGGHVLGANIESADIAWDYTDGFAMLLPETKMFSSLDLTVDQSKDIKKVETDVSR
ncbi:MAG: acetolactate decarboxylase [Stomatobaculum sp.]|nr:acetolactate decarboxylase [Stomatobaculum sp.]